MHKLLLAGSAAVALMATPGAYAQNTRELPAQTTNTGSPAPSSSAPVLTSEQKAIHDAWTAQQKADYAAWPNDYKVYYWTLNAEQQEGYWALTADQRGQIYKMTPEQRQMAWNSVVQQMNGQTPATPAGQANPPGQGVPTAGVPDPQTASQAARPAMPADENYQGGGVSAPL